MPTEPIEVLLVEDNPADARLLVESLRDARTGAFHVTHVSRLAAAVEALGRRAPDVIALDLSLPDSSGLDTVDRLQAVAPGVPVVVLTGLQDEALALQAVRKGVQDYLVKGHCEDGLAARALRYAVERRRAEEALRRSEAQLRAVLEHLPVGVWFTDAAGRIVFGNPAGGRIWGGARYVGIDQFDQYKGWWPDTGEPVKPEEWGLARAMRTGEALLDELVEIETFDGSRKAILNSAVPLRDEAGRVTGGLVINVDVTERRRAAEALRESEGRFRALADGAPVLIWVNGPDGAEFVNRTYLEFLGVPSETDVRGYDWAQFVHPEDRDAYVGAYLDCLARRADFEAQFRFRRHDGVYRWMRSIGRPRFTAAGAFIGFVGSTADITEIRQAQDALRDREARYRAVVETAVDAIITIDENGVIDSINPAAVRTFGYTPDEVLGRNVSMLMPEPYRSQHDTYVRNYLRTGRAKIIGAGREVVGLRKDGTTFPMDLSVSEFSAGGRQMFTGLVHDATNRRRLEQQILEASAAEQRRIGHELHDGLCQQLAALAFSVEMLDRRLQGKAPDEGPAVRKLAAEVDAATTLARTLSHGLNPVDVHAGGLPAALKGLASKVSELYQVDCRFRRQGTPPETDGATSTHLYRIAQEAISNAVRHGKARHIDLHLNGSPGVLTLSVEDDGTGLPADSQGKPGQAKPPSGIGLQTMAYRARMMGGVLDVRPGRTRGVVVMCSIPVRPEQDGGVRRRTKASSRRASGPERPATEAPKRKTPMTRRQRPSN